MGLVPSAYRSLFAIPGVTRLMVSALVARLPVGIIALAFVLFVHHLDGGFALAGVTAATYALAQGCVSPLLGRLADRFGQTRILLGGGTVHALALAGAVTAGLIGSPIAVVVILAGLSGAARPPVSACLRGALSATVTPGAQLESAYALESVLVEVINVAGPLFTVMLSALGSPAAALLCAAALSLVGIGAFATSQAARAWRPVPRTTGRAGAFAAAGMRVLTIAALLVGGAFGTLQVALPAFASDHGHASAGGLALAAMSLASLIAGLWYGTRSLSSRPEQRYLWLSGLYAVALIAPVFAGSIPGIIGLVALSGLLLAPLGICTYTLIDRLAPAGTLTEAFAWLTAASTAGTAGGNAIAGALSGSIGVRAALVVAATLGAGALVVSLAGRRTLQAEIERRRSVSPAPA